MVRVQAVRPPLIDAQLCVLACCPVVQGRPTLVAGTWVTVTGQMFPSAPSLVRIGENECRALRSVSATRLVCLTSPSYSRSETAAVEISVDRQLISAVGFSYDPPAVLRAEPSNAPAECAR